MEQDKLTAHRKHSKNQTKQLLLRLQQRISKVQHLFTKGKATQLPDNINSTSLRNLKFHQLNSL